MVGYLRGERPAGMDCEQPLRFVCRSCDAAEVWACNCSSSERCRPCSERNRRRNEQVVFTGLSNRAGSGHAYFLTLTAPGNPDPDHRCWVPGWNRSMGPRPKCSCWDTGMPLAEWNVGAGASWNRLRTALSRHVDQRLEFWRAAEAQERGALHHHVVVWSPEPLDYAVVQAYAVAAGYGCVMDLRVCQDAAQVARYISKYVTKGDERRRVSWSREVVDKRTGELRQETDASYRTHSQSHGWGVTLKGLRDIARAQAQARAAHLAMLAELGLAAPSVLGESGAAAGPEPPG